MFKVFLNDNIKYMRTDKVAAKKFDLSYFYWTVKQSFNSSVDLLSTYRAYYIDPQLDYNPIEDSNDLEIIVTKVIKLLNLKQIPILLLKIEDLLSFRNPQFMQLFIRKLIDV